MKLILYAAMGTLLPLDVLYFLIVWSFPPRSQDVSVHWAYVWKLAIVGGIAVAITLALTVKGLEKNRDWLK